MQASEQEYLLLQIRELNTETYVTKDQLHSEMSNVLGFGFGYITIFLGILSFIGLVLLGISWNIRNKAEKELKEVRGIKEKIENERDNLETKNQEVFSKIESEIRSYGVKEMNRLNTELSTKFEKKFEEKITKEHNERLYDSLINDAESFMDRKIYKKAREYYRKALNYEDEKLKGYIYERITYAYIFEGLKNKDIELKSYKKALREVEKVPEYHEKLMKYFIEQDASAKTIKGMKETITRVNEKIQELKHDIKKIENKESKS